MDIGDVYVPLIIIYIVYCMYFVYKGLYSSNTAAYEILHSHRVFKPRFDMLSYCILFTRCILVLYSEYYCSIMAVHPAILSPY